MHLFTAAFRPDVASWPAQSMDAEPFEAEQFDTGQFLGQSPSPMLDSMSSSSSKSSLSPELQPGSKGATAMHKIKTGKVAKKKSAKKPAAEQSGKFVIMTPTSINAQSGRPNPFECFEAMHTSHKGRKGPLADDTKKSALQVRRLGACFCCHSRKVKCDKERPCKNCKKLMLIVPQIVCWQFPDFLPVLFPAFFRRHLKKDEVARFITENIEAFSINGLEKPCTVELFSGTRFGSVLRIRGKFFTPKTDDVMRQWHVHANHDGVDLQSKNAVPIGIDPEQGGLKDELPKQCREYVRDILREPAYAEQLTETLQHTDLPRRILHIVGNYRAQTDVSCLPTPLSIGKQICADQWRLTYPGSPPLSDGP